MRNKSDEAEERPSRRWSGELGKPITIPFRGEHGLDELSGGFVKQFKKLSLLADHYKIEQKGDCGWGYLLAFKIACDLHPGFQIEYENDVQARAYDAAFGFTVYPVKAKNSVRANGAKGRPKNSGFAPSLPADVMAFLIDRLKENAKRDGLTLSDQRLCEMLAILQDPGLGRRDRPGERRKKANTLRRRLTQGRRLVKKEKSQGALSTGN